MKKTNKKNILPEEFFFFVKYFRRRQTPWVGKKGRKEKRGKIKGKYINRVQKAAS